MTAFLRRALVGLLLGVVLLTVAGWWWARNFAGAGALHQFAPTTVPAGATFEIKVLAGVWGEGRKPAVRYSGWSLLLLQDGRPVGPPLAPARMGLEGERVALWFTPTAPVVLTSGAPALTWRLGFRFDGKDQELAGLHEITVVP